MMTNMLTGITRIKGELLVKRIALVTLENASVATGANKSKVKQLKKEIFVLESRLSQLTSALTRPSGVALR